MYSCFTHAMTAYVGAEVHLYLFLTSTADEVECLATSRPLYRRKEPYRYPLWGRAYTRMQNRCRCRRRYRCCHQYNKGLVFTHTPTKSVSGRLQGGQFREWCRAVNMVAMWNRRFYLLCSLPLRRRRRKTERKRILGASYSTRKHTWRRLWETPREMRGSSVTTLEWVLLHWTTLWIAWLLISNARTQWCGKTFVHGKCLQ
jgi:hypothetical protein